jgi:hypothetical protein
MTDPSQPRPEEIEGLEVDKETRHDLTESESEQVQGGRYSVVFPPPPPPTG